MSRKSHRLLALAAIAALVLSIAPAAYARTPEGAQTSVRVDAGWLGTALHWLADLFGADRPASTRTEATSGVAKTTYQPNGGACIDPMGHPRPWCLQ